MLILQSSRRKYVKTPENKGFLSDPPSCGTESAVKIAENGKITNKINCFMPVSYGTALNRFDDNNSLFF
jgi:hypothetical protein